MFISEESKRPRRHLRQGDDSSPHFCIRKPCLEGKNVGPSGETLPSRYHVVDIMSIGRRGIESCSVNGRGEGGPWLLIRCLIVLDGYGWENVPYSRLCDTGHFKALRGRVRALRGDPGDSILHRLRLQCTWYAVNCSVRLTNFELQKFRPLAGSPRSLS